MSSRETQAAGEGSASARAAAWLPPWDEAASGGKGLMVLSSLVELMGGKDYICPGVS